MTVHVDVLVLVLMLVDEWMAQIEHVIEHEHEHVNVQVL